MERYSARHLGRNVFWMPNVAKDLNAILDNANFERLFLTAEKQERLAVHIILAMMMQTTSVINFMNLMILDVIGNV